MSCFCSGQKSAAVLVLVRSLETCCSSRKKTFQLFNNSQTSGTSLPLRFISHVAWASRRGCLSTVPLARPPVSNCNCRYRHQDTSLGLQVPSPGGSDTQHDSERPTTRTHDLSRRSPPRTKSRSHTHDARRTRYTQTLGLPCTPTCQHPSYSSAAVTHEPIRACSGQYSTNVSHAVRVCSHGSRTCGPSCAPSPTFPHPARRTDRRPAASLSEAQPYMPFRTGII